MRENLSLFLFLGLISFVGYDYYQNREIKRPIGELVINEPTQVDLPIDAKAFMHNQEVLQPLAVFSGKFRVLGKEPYRFDHGSRMAPTDFALGWKKMSDSKFLNQLDISQGSRFFYVRWQRLNQITEEEIFDQSSNIHIIPANKNVEKIIKKVRVGHIISMNGKLVRIDFKSGGEWRSSLSRKDRGNGACELFYVESLKIEL